MGYQGIVPLKIARISRTPQSGRGWSSSIRIGSVSRVLKPLRTWYGSAKGAKPVMSTDATGSITICCISTKPVAPDGHNSQMVATEGSYGAATDEKLALHTAPNANLSLHDASNIRVGAVLHQVKFC